MRVSDAVLFPLHREGWKFVPIFAGVSLLAAWLWTPLGLIGLALTVWCYYFFRDPVRSVPQDDGLLVSPADGVISLLQPAAPPPELGLGDTPRTRISVFMNVFNCHVNRAPHAGEVLKVAYHAGQFLNASLDKASEKNERNSILIQLPEGHDLPVVQIAGLVARRILCEAREGDHLATGERYGLIRFGSRLDIYLPDGVEPLVDVGQTMVAGETVLARLDGPQSRRSARDI
ncbi:MAG: phosphatidylserine decarboxylase [Pseudomonadota bacterium]